MVDSNDYSFQGTGLSTKEKNWAKGRYEEYQKHYYINSFSDNQLLEELVFYESLQERYKKQIQKTEKQVEEAVEEVVDGKKKTKKKKVYVKIPDWLLDALDNNLKTILNLKKQLGLLNKEDIDEAKTEKQKLKKFRIWQLENQACREGQCTKCGEMVLFAVKVDHYNMHKHPNFMDVHFFNKPAWRCYFGKKITKLELAKIMLGEDTTLSDYIDWVERELESHPEFIALKKEFPNA